MSSAGDPGVVPEGGSTLHGVLVTYRRSVELEHTLAQLAEQDRTLDRIIIVDNAASPETEEVVRRFTERGMPLEYLATEENLGFAGGVAVGMERVLASAGDDDWIVVLDDDDPPRTRTEIGDLERFARARVAHDPRTAVVGIHGARFDWRRGRVARVPDEELRGPVSVDYVGGNGLPFHRVRAIRDVGGYSRDVFFGGSEIEHGLRIRGAGYTAYAHGDLWQDARTAAGRIGRDARPARRLGAPDWRRYYSLRNLIHMLRGHGRLMPAVRVTAIGLGKPLANLFVTPRLAARHLALNWKAIRDGWRGRMGRTVEPEPWARRSTKARPPLT